MKDDLIVDLFCGGGGTADGVRRALGRGPDISVNHNMHAIAMHKANHPKTHHVCGDVFSVRPSRVVPTGTAVQLVTASPDCRHFSRAKGSPKVSPRIRTLARSLIPWARQVQPAMMIVENVWEFTTWGPLMRGMGPEGPYWMPNPAKAGQYFQKFVRDLRECGYEVDWKQLNAADFGAPTARKRFFLVARRDGQPIEWPEPSHGPGRAKPWHTAAECIDWSIPMQSVFGRKKDLAEATQRRIAAGFMKYVLGIGAKPNAQVGAWVERMHSTSRGERADVPLSAITAQPRNRFGLCHAKAGETNEKRQQVIRWVERYYSHGGHSSDLELPLPTIRTRNCMALIEVRIKDLQIVDILFRMFQPRELATAMGFEEDYILTGTKEQQVERIGNAVCPQVPEAIIRANMSAIQPMQEAA
jgi:DNA (cytosine-5)-methyltransferase 1